MPYASVSEVWPGWTSSEDKSYGVAPMQSIINQEIRTQTHDSIAQQPNHDCIDDNSYMLSTRSNRSNVVEDAGSGIIEGFNGNIDGTSSRMGNDIESADLYRNAGSGASLSNSFDGKLTPTYISPPSNSRRYSHMPQGITQRSDLHSMGSNTYSSPFVDDYKLIPADLEFELEEATKRLTHENVKDHIRHCNKCKAEIREELGIEIKEENKVIEEFHERDNEEEEKDQLSDLIEILTFIFGGIALILILDTFVRLGKGSKQ